MDSWHIHSFLEETQSDILVFLSSQITDSCLFGIRVKDQYRQFCWLFFKLAFKNVLPLTYLVLTFYSCTMWHFTSHAKKRNTQQYKQTCSSEPWDCWTLWHECGVGVTDMVRLQETPRVSQSEICPLSETPDRSRITTADGSPGVFTGQTVRDIQVPKQARTPRITYWWHLLEDSLHVTLNKPF